MFSFHRLSYINICGCFTLTNDIFKLSQLNLMTFNNNTLALFEVILTNSLAMILVFIYESEINIKLFERRRRECLYKLFEINFKKFQVIQSTTMI